jgi:hypothetical protein
MKIGVFLQIVILDGLGVLSRDNPVSVASSWKQTVRSSQAGPSAGSLCKFSSPTHYLTESANDLSL